MDEAEKEERQIQAEQEKKDKAEEDEQRREDAAAAAEDKTVEKNEEVLDKETAGAKSDEDVEQAPNFKEDWDAPSEKKKAAAKAPKDAATSHLISAPVTKIVVTK
jgi:hypothetical protein